MNCHDALLQLEVARPGSDDLSSSECEGAAAHLDGCGECAATFGKRQTLDARISRVMRDVPIPAGLKERMLMSLTATVGADTVGAASDADGPLPRVAQPATGFARVRTRIAAAISVSAVLLAALFYLFPNQPTTVKFTLANVYDSADLRVGQLDAFDENFQPLLPAGPWRRGTRITVAKTPKGDLKSLAGKHRSATYAFRVRDERGNTFHGVLLVITKSVLDDIPSSDLFSTADTPGVYYKRTYGSFQAVSWKEGNFVYVCFMPAENDGIKTLEDVIHPMAV